MKHRKMITRTAAVASCAAIGAVAGIAGSAAAPAHKAQAKEAPALQVAIANVKFGGPPVHSVIVVPNNSNGFDTLTQDHGKVVSVSGDTLKITEGTTSATYATPTLTIPANATIVRNGAKAPLSDLRVGDTVDVMQSPDGTTHVMAFDAQHQPTMKFMTGAPGAPGGPKSPPLPGPPGPGVSMGYSVSAP